MSQVRINGDTVHVTIAPYLGGKGTSIPEISEMTLTLPGFHKEKEAALQAVQAILKAECKIPLQGIISMDYSRIPETKSIDDECEAIMYSRTNRSPNVNSIQKGEGEGIKYEGTFDVYSGKVKLGGHREIMSQASALTELLIPSINESALFKVCGQVNSYLIKRSTHQDPEFLFSMQKSGRPVEITLTDEEGHEHNISEKRMITTNNLNRCDTRIPTSQDSKGFYSWSTIRYMPTGNTVIQHHRVVDPVNTGSQF
ncbi:uncharacterized protein IL334_006489 [Kwoniella shivajii]|uniref:Uncharacterized protein n=1 Tax=Kwoniella shivajii TaxID=564305 RepID=A0ABZ1D635_9TREE|nr:hypothetical protein IL334_006489 [Kwoniella shivajii]